MSYCSDYIYGRGVEFYKLTGRFPPLKSLGKPRPIPWYLFKINVFQAEKILGIKRELDFWGLLREYLTNEIEDDIFFDILLKITKKPKSETVENKG